MNDMAHWPSQARPVPVGRSTFHRSGFGRRGSAASGSLSLLFSAATTGLVLLVGFALALVFAATLAVVMVLAAGLFALATLAWRVRPRTAAAAARPGHAWVAYDWDDRRR